MDNDHAKDFRYIPADAIGLTANDNNVKIRFGIEHEPGKITDQVGVFMTLKTLKLLHEITTNIFESLEKIGVSVELDDEKIKEMKEGGRPRDTTSPRARRRPG